MRRKITLARYDREVPVTDIPAQTITEYEITQLTNILVVESFGRRKYRVGDMMPEKDVEMLMQSGTYEIVINH